MCIFFPPAGYRINASVGHRCPVVRRSWSSRLSSAGLRASGYRVRGPSASPRPHSEPGQRGGALGARRRELCIQHRRGTRLHSTQPGGAPRSGASGHHVQSTTDRRCSSSARDPRGSVARRLRPG